jgi:hypothetical protein
MSSSAFTSISIEKEYGYVVLVAIGFWLLQFLFMIPIAIMRNKTGIKPPTLYPTDKQVTSLKLSPETVDSYLRTQRVHQNHMEFLVMFFPILLLAGLYDAKHAAIAGAVTLLGRVVTGLGYYYNASARNIGGW